jgi:hypothetical protein
MAIQFDGTLTTGYQAAPSFIPKAHSFPLTVCFFAKITTAQPTFTSFFSYFCTSGAYVIETAADGVTLEVGDGKGAGGTVTAEALIVGVWYFIAFTVDTALNSRLYWKKVGAPTCRFVSAVQSDLTIMLLVLLANDGNNGTGDDYFNGQMAGVRIWNQALSQGTLERESGVINAINKSGLLYAWSLDSDKDLLNHSKTRATLVITTGGSGGSAASMTPAPNPPVLRIKPSTA